MISVVVIGARGYTGAELLPLLHRHPEFEIVAVGSASAAGQYVHEHVDGMGGCDLLFSGIRPNTLERYKADACVLALPNGFATEFVSALDEPQTRHGCCRPECRPPLLIRAGHTDNPSGFLRRSPVQPGLPTQVVTPPAPNWPWRQCSTNCLDCRWRLVCPVTAALAKHRRGKMIPMSSRTTCCPIR